VRLGNDNDATDPEWAELVEDHIHDGGLRALRSFHQRVLHSLEAVEHL